MFSINGERDENSERVEMKKTRIQNYGVNSLEVLLIVFVILKLIGVISWSWWWVLSPFWIPVILVIILLVIYFIIKQV